MPLSRWRAGASERSGKAGKVPNGICAAMQMDWSIVAVCVCGHVEMGFLGLLGKCSSPANHVPGLWRAELQSGLHFLPWC